MQDQNKGRKKASRPVDDDGEVAPEMREALASYFEKLNGGEIDPAIDPAALLATAHPETQAEWQRTMALLKVSQRQGQAVTSVNAAWQRFRTRAFENATAEAASLGGYVAQNEQDAIQESGLPATTHEALKSDPTPLAELKGYRINDYADLARRYGVEDSLFPRMLKWLKGLGKSLTAPSSGGAMRGMVFARDEEARQSGLSETELSEELAKKDQEKEKE